MNESDYLLEKHLQTDAEEPKLYAVYADDGRHRYKCIVTSDKAAAENHAKALRENLCTDFKVEVVRE